ncbi:mucin-5AC-like [Pistacia vera]|uniref:mucin-5AC-like n=1 Tax=Pistacia vera TaxID=55513 RepID=UPI001263BAF2|nr:mucin-5AC-like [Pistacia vera]
MKGYAEILSASGVVISDDELINYILDRLDSEYDAAVVNVTTRLESRVDPIIVQEAQIFLQKFELRLEKANRAMNSMVHAEFHSSLANIANLSTDNDAKKITSSPIYTPQQTQFFTPHFSGNYTGGRGRGRAGARNSSYAKYVGKQLQNNFQSQSLSAAGHSSGSLDTNFGTSQMHNQAFMAQSQNHSRPLTAINYIATPSSIQDTAWYMDSGATDHVTSDFSQLTSSSNYMGREQLQDKSSQAILLQGTLKFGLYQLQSSACSTPKSTTVLVSSFNSMPSHCLASFPCYSNKDPSNPMNKQPELSSVHNECYSLNHKGYQCLSPSSRIYICQSVTFDESEFPFKSFTESTPLTSNNTMNSESFPSTSGHPSWSIPVSTLQISSPVNSESTCPTTHDQLKTSILAPNTVPSIKSVPSAVGSLALDPYQCTSTSAFSLKVSTKSLPTPSEFLSSPSAPTDTTQSAPYDSDQSFNTRTFADPLPLTEPSVPSTINTHLMVTRAKANAHNTTLLSTSALDTVTEALTHPAWKVAMQSKYDALLSNKTWELVPASSEI